MCWITLSPAKRHHHHTHHSDPGSSVEELVRIRHDAYNPRYSKVRIVAPSIVVEDDHHHHHRHHLHPHIHPLHMHPIHNHHSVRLHGPGKKRCPPPPPPPPSRNPSRCREPDREPIYRTQIVEPARTQEVRETTRIALREVRPERRERGRLRRVAGYEVLGREVPWSWDCVSSAASGGGSRGGRSGSGLRFPPFGGMDRWM
ncbi:hypothetical protein BU26DRAFT_544717 [Trematosphaeria pertusa]|uniref:Uncharacterized protein n=1 Tax=Trematosphaeria pertusa TaxID=390896 RepID=A0A6A6HRD8_9PLEO|nr:uncharacterized protein BU26DRAFT_544717 [Trematosphaeria pertusa]KAF2240724.1 hypothetical protein BU26DRAFT_544717 [Trematosphaeria pertusa]